MNKKEYQKLYRQYLEALPSMKKSALTIRSYELAMRKFENYLKDDEVISPLSIVNFRTELTENGVSTNTVRQYLVELRTFFEWCERMHIIHIEDNPIQREDIPEMQTRDYDLLSIDEIQKLFGESPTQILSKTACRNRAIVVLLVMVGLRNSELRNLKLSDLDFDKRTINVKHGKGDKSRTVAFPKLARSIVQQYLNSGLRPFDLSDDDYLFGDDSIKEYGKIRQKESNENNGSVWHQFSSTGLLTLVKRYTRYCCGHEVKTHALRHAATSYWAEIGVPIREVQQALGHQSIRTTESTYLHVLNRTGVAENINLAFEKIGL